MEYQLQDFDVDDETDFLLGQPKHRRNNSNSSSYDGGEIFVRNRSQPRRRRNLLTMVCW